ncbi:MAG TPA: bifunctional demethylmenaquinone methyltransferase/2-methoxy-6-polyprenyl-1,4-benzoquinol methylase UbiE [Vicinamibacterales bacterium]|nr:bifunctional demethylmenaquinone methyltransferase/2-methoxy-6-polyprenyl-1,4-benzoquinol methylase UbiE [Vicinamibacterales bacterium]
MSDREGDEPSKAPREIAGMFDAIAGRYDFLNHLLSAGIDRRWRRRAIRSLALTGRERVLDLCTGTADLAIAARTARPGAARVLGVDFAGAMLAIGQDKIRRAALERTVTLVRGDATRVPAAPGSIDAVTIAFGIRNVQDPAAAAAEIVRVLKPGGRVAILEFAVPPSPVVRGLYLWYFKHILPAIGRVVSRHRAAYTYLPASVGAFAAPDEFVKILRHAGLREVSSVPLTFGIVFLYTGCR